jgi:hypothetical protein
MPAAKPEDHRILFSKELPVLLLTLFAALAWTTQRVIDRATQLPLVSFETTAIANRPAPGGCADTIDKSYQVFEIRFENLSGAAFQDVKFIFRVNADSAKIFAVRWFDDPPARTNAKPSEDCPAIAAQTGSITVSEMQPGWSGRARVWTTNNPELTIHHQSIAATDLKPLRLTPEGVVTKLVRNEFTVFLSLAGLLVVLSIGYLFLLKFGRR